MLSDESSQQSPTVKMSVVQAPVSVPPAVAEINGWLSQSVSQFISPAGSASSRVSKSSRMLQILFAHFCRVHSQVPAVV